VAIRAEEADLDIFLCCCEHCGISRNAQITQQRRFGEKFEVCETLMVLSYYCAGLEFVNCGGGEEGSEEQNHDCGVEGRGLRLEVQGPLDQGSGVHWRN